MDIFIFSTLTNFVYYCAGFILLSHYKFGDNSKFFTFFVGAVTFSFIALVLNFFLPLNQLTNTLVYCVVVIIFLFKIKFNINKNFLFFLIISSFITFLLIIKSNVNRPDAGLYHLPYISILNENKVFFGLTNIHSRFGHVSILQYLSAINNNTIFSNNGISIPLASIVSYFYIYFFLDVWNIQKNNEQLNSSKIFSLFILIYIAYKVTRYSSFGNDAVAHLCYFYLISSILKEKLKKINLNKILLVSVFIFINKPMMGIVFAIPALIFFFQNNLKIHEIIKQTFSLPVLFLSIWLIKNLIISGCVIFPMKSSCVEKLPWTNIEQITSAQIEGQVWSKGWPDRTNKKISMQEFNKNFNWLETWSKKHMKYIINILIPYILILISILIFQKKIKERKNLGYDYNDFKKRYLIAISTSFVGIVSFFVIFPIYRYGYSYLVTFISLLILTFVKISTNNKRNFLIIRFFLILSIIVFLAKQSQKLVINNNNTLWPNIYSFNNNEKNKMKITQKIKIKENFYYFYANKGDNLCMYSKSPCTSYIISDKIRHVKKNNYSFFLTNN